MTLHDTAPTTPPPPQEFVTRDGECVVVDVTDLILPRLVELLEARPALIADLAASTLRDGRDADRARARIAAGLRRNPQVRAVSTFRLSTAQATDLAAALIAAAAQPAPVRRHRRTVGPPAHRGLNTTATDRKDPQS